MKTVKLNPVQKQAFVKLQEALLACEQAKVHLWDHCGSIAAANGNHVLFIAPDPILDEPVDLDDIETFHTGCWNGFTDDNDLYVGWRWD